MTEECQAKWVATEEQIQSIIIPAMKNIAQQCAGYGEKLQCPPEFIAVMLRDIAYAFDEKPAEGESSYLWVLLTTSSCWELSLRFLRGI